MQKEKDQEKIPGTPSVSVVESTTTPPGGKQTTLSAATYIRQYESGKFTNNAYVKIAADGLIRKALKKFRRENLTAAEWRKLTGGN